MYTYDLSCVQAVFFILLDGPQHGLDKYFYHHLNYLHKSTEITHKLNVLCQSLHYLPGQVYFVSHTSPVAGRTSKVTLLLLLTYSKGQFSLQISTPLNTIHQMPAAHLTTSIPLVCDKSTRADSILDTGVYSGQNAFHIFLVDLNITLFDLFLFIKSGCTVSIKVPVA